MKSALLHGYIRRICGWPLLCIGCNLANRIGGEIRRHGLAGFCTRLPYYLRHYRTYLRIITTPPPAGERQLFDAGTVPRQTIRLHPDLTGVHEDLDASVSVIIPTLNAGAEFHRLLRKLWAQRSLHRIEIVVVDSGSSDGTVACARAAGCMVIEIPPAEFSHSHARNLGADAAQGEYLLFMVQDAYPIGDYWLYAMIKYLLDHAGDNLAAVSCAEYSRSDSDLTYDWMINTHYRFLGCLDHDRIGEFKGEDHTLLRSYGQLSDVACLMARPLFSRYRYRGDYAEDLDLGIRLIRDGYRVAMLASVKVVHSHNRPAYYYLKRSFVDTIHLVGLFDDYVYPHVESLTGLIAGIVSVSAHLSDWLAGFDADRTGGNAGKELGGWIGQWRDHFQAVHPDGRSRLGEPRLDEFIDSLAERFLAGDLRMNGAARREARSFADAFLARLEHFQSFVSTVYGGQDVALRHQLKTAVCKNFAATAGSALGYLYMDVRQTSGRERDLAETLKQQLQAGI